MKVLICNLAIFVWLAFSLNAQAQTIEKNRTVKETFPVGEDAEIEIANKYGSIHIIPWESDSVKFEIEIMVKGNKQSRVDKSFDYIEIDFKTSKYYIIAQTLFAGKSSFWSDVSDITGAIFNSNTKTMINYKVYLPTDSKLKIQNKYGNIYTTDHEGPIEIDLSNGDLKAHHFSGKTKIRTEFGNSDIKKIDFGSLNISYAELRLEEGGVLEMETKSSKFYFDKIDQLKINSKRDKYYLKEINELTGSTYFTLVDLEQLISKLDLTLRYGDFEINNFADKVESFNLKTDDTDVILHFTDDKYYDMDIIVNESTQVKYSADIKDITSKEIDGEEKLIQVKCKTGFDKSRVIPIEVDSRAGTLSLKLK